MTIPLILLYLVPLEIHTHKTKLISFIQISQAIFAFLKNISKYHEEQIITAGIKYNSYQIVHVCNFIIIYGAILYNHENDEIKIRDCTIT